MPHDDHIALGLRLDGRNPKATATDPFQVVRAATDRLFAVLSDVIVVVELADEGALKHRIDGHRQMMQNAGNADQIMDAVSACVDSCRGALARIEAQRLEQQKEIASLVDLVREALEIMSGGSEKFHGNIGHSLERFEALVQISDVRMLKLQLVQEVRTLKQITADRQKEWLETASQFSSRVAMLESELEASKRDAALDPLSRIANRRTFDRACREWLSAKRLQFVLAVIDIDDFKAINDRFGHPVGDQTILTVAQTLRSSVRANDDIVARIGGDEFALLISDLPLPQVEARLRMVGQSLAAVSLQAPSGESYRVTLSCGIVECAAGDTAESLLERADTALYEAKRLGRNRVITKVKPTLRDLLRS